MADIPRKAVRITKLDTGQFDYVNQYSVEFMEVAKEYVVKEFKNLEEVLKKVKEFLK
jgi:uncharacterized protein YlzI (FlbEa/FlbD family)